MEADSARSELADPAREQNLANDQNDIDGLSPLNIDYDFDESQCLFCNHTCPDLEHNLTHMSKSHGLYIESTKLLVDIVSLLAYFHLIISGYYECLYCRTQRNTREAVQQHMMAKGHCKYDITDKDGEIRDFYELSSSDEAEDRRSNLHVRHLLHNSHGLPQKRSSKPRPSRNPDTHGSNDTAPILDPSQWTPVPPPENEDGLSSSAADPPANSGRELSTRAIKQAHNLNNQLARLRAGDQKSLSHLPASQQRALLATHHQQVEKARRTEQTQRGNLESAGNHFSRLGTIRLMRKPPHFGHVHSLNN